MARPKKEQLKMFVFQEKHGDRYVLIPSDNKKAYILRQMLLEREQEGMYDEEEIEKKHLPFYKAALIDEKKATPEELEAAEDAASTFMNLRSQGEYEGFQIEYLEEL